MKELFARACDTVSDFFLTILIGFLIGLGIAATMYPIMFVLRLFDVI